MKKIDQDLYKKIPINNLIVFCIYSISEKKEKCTFDNLVKECFNFFPKTLAFKNNLKLPDSRKLDRPLRSLRRKNIIKGSPQTEFFLTKTGKELAREIFKTFNQRKLI